MPQSKFSVWILILTLCALLTACGGSSGSDPQPEPHQPPPGQSTPGDDNEPDDPGGNTEPEPITTPNSFSFAPQEGVTPGELLESNTITLTGITAPATISIANGEYKLGDGSFTAERSEEHTSELQSRGHLVCRLLLEKKKKPIKRNHDLI